MKKLALLLLMACHPLSTLDVLRKEGATPLQPPAWYEADWHRLEACSGLKGDFAAVSWYQSPQIAVADSSYRGGYLPKNHAIVILDNALNNHTVVNHEEMHALLRGGMDHPIKYFNGSCGDLL